MFDFDTVASLSDPAALAPPSPLPLIVFNAPWRPSITDAAAGMTHFYTPAAANRTASRHGLKDTGVIGAAVSSGRCA